jgi:hypothetical protein
MDDQHREGRVNTKRDLGCTGCEIQTALKSLRTTPNTFSITGNEISGC